MMMEGKMKSGLILIMMFCIAFVNAQQVQPNPQGGAEKLNKVNYQAEYGRLTKENDQLRSEISKLRSELDRLKKQNASLNNRIDRLNKENSNFKKQQSEFNKLKREMATLQREFDKMKVELDNYKGKPLNKVEKN
jgi:predicted RNase H-like nuclease (RuvC/YqgF family)